MKGMENMTKKLVTFRLSEAARNYLVEKSTRESKTQLQIIEELILLDRQKKNGYVDELAKAISKKMGDELKSIRIAVNENNKILKIQQHIINYQMLAQELRMDYHLYEEGTYRHFAFGHAEKIVKAEIKALQVIKAEQRKKVKAVNVYESDGASQSDLPEKFEAESE
jgi:hypothetical protein